MKQAFCTMSLLFLMFVAGTGCHSRGEASTSAQVATSATSQTEPTVSTARLSAVEAITKAREQSPGASWKVANISNNGVARSVAENLARPEDGGMIQAEGRAHHWVVELYQDTPKPFVDEGRRGLEYPFKVLSVTPEDVMQIGDDRMSTKKSIAPVTERHLQGLERAHQRALRQVKAHYDVYSVASWIESGGRGHWLFRFYDMKHHDVTAMLQFSGDGRVLERRK